MTRMAGSLLLLVGAAFMAAATASAQEGTMPMDEFIRTVCIGNTHCEESGAKSVEDNKGIIVTLAAMCQQIPRSKEEGECFETGYGLTSVLESSALQSTLDSLETSRDQLVRYLASVHKDCGKSNKCYWARLMGFEREYKIYEPHDAK